ncbi:MAG: hypothetical protein K8S97_09940, partial [Anaerolineae bacterium]|nr:hypothetical protein [Anaerolineae bacterium]
RTQARVLRTRLGLSPYYFPWELREENATARAWTITAEICSELADNAAQHGVPVIFVLLPGDMQVDDTILDWYLDVYDIDPQQVDWDQPARILTRELTARGLTVFDPTLDIRAAIADGHDALYGRVDNHFNPAGNRIMGRLLADWLLTQHPELLTG